MLNIIPLPAALELRPGEFHLTAETGIQSDEANRWNAGYLRDLLARPSGLPLPISTGDLARRRGSIRLGIDPSQTCLGEEGYQLEVQPDGVNLSAGTSCGIFHAIQTLRQMLPVDVEGGHPAADVGWKLPCAAIRDQPRFAWRGFMLDEGRHFHGMETVLLTLDLMAMQKLNIFHWHLTEDQGWRIEIRKYPRLTEIGAWRGGTSRSMGGKGHDGIRHGGFYTRAEILEIVAYAAQRHIQVVPEIEMPGHSLAALAAYPEYACTGGPFDVATGFGIFPDIYCAGREKTYTFLQDVLGEVLELFPSPIVHIGGDESPKARWKKCPACQERMRSEGLVDEHALQGYMTNRMAVFLKSKGRKLMGWNQILQDGLVPGCVVQYWLGNRHKLVEAVNAGQDAVMSTYLDAYLDHGYNLMPLSRAYQYEPVPPGVKEEAVPHILGLEFPLWTEWVPDRPRLDYQVYPRLAAMAETGWTPKEKKDFGSFRRRLAPFMERLHNLGVHPASLKEAEPPFYKRWFSVFTIAQAQKKVAGGRHENSHAAG